MLKEDCKSYDNIARSFHTQHYEKFTIIQLQHHWHLEQGRNEQVRLADGRRLRGAPLQKSSGGAKMAIMGQINVRWWEKKWKYKNLQAAPNGYKGRQINVRWWGTNLGVQKLQGRNKPIRETNKKVATFFFGDSKNFVLCRGAIRI